MPKNEAVQRLQRKKKDKAVSKDQPVQEVQKNQGNSTSADATATSDKQQNTRDREHTLQQEKSNPNDAGDKRIIQMNYPTAPRVCLWANPLRRSGVSRREKRRET